MLLLHTNQKKKMNRKILSHYYYFALSILLVLVQVGCLPNYTNHSEEWKQEKIESLSTQYARKYPDVRNISAEELQKLQQQEDVVLVDVRTSEEMEVSMIMGAISRAEFEREQDKYKNYTIVPYCTIGNRSIAYAEQLQERGFDVFNLQGSILSWTHVGGKLVNSTGITNRIHVSERKWELAAENYQMVW